MPQISLKPTQKIIANYYRALAESAQMSQGHEGAVAPHFAALLRACAAPLGWTLQEQYPIPRKGQHPIRVDGALLDLFQLRHGVWEAKDRGDDLHREVRAKFKQGYPNDNILFQSPERAILVQNGREAADEDIRDPEKLVEVLKLFFSHQPREFDQWEQAVAEFKDKVPELAQSLLALIEKERKENKRFVAALDEFTELARQSINPNIATQAVEEMLIQHLLTERIFRRVFNNPDFARRNIIAHEIEKVIGALTSRSFSREEFLGKLDRFYGAIETTAATITDYREKQSFLNTVYEQFFQGFSVKVADTHGIVYTPQSIVDFMVRSVDDILRREFGKPDGLASDGVAILDPFVGTGNFILRAMRQMPKSKLPGKYASELFCNEVMLLPYYIASMNIEHEYYELTGQYEPFEGIALVDTFELAEGRQLPLFVKENTQRVQRQKDAPIRVIIGNPPYNAHQVNENDNSKNRRYPVVDSRVSDTYAKDSKATLKNQLSDPYVRAFRWATDRIGSEGIVAYVSNNSFVDGVAFDGMRQHLARDYTSLYIVDLKGNVRKNPSISGTTHNVFGIQVGVSIALLVKHPVSTQRVARIYYAAIDDYWKKEERLRYLDLQNFLVDVDWIEVEPTPQQLWLTDGMQGDFASHIPIGIKGTQTLNGHDSAAIFRLFSSGVNTGRDAWVYNYDEYTLLGKVEETIDYFNSHVQRRARQAGTRPYIDDFVIYEDSRISWSSTLKSRIDRGAFGQFDPEFLRAAAYRPFSKLFLYFDPLLVDRPGLFSRFFPSSTSEQENAAICVPGRGNRKAFGTMMVSKIASMDFAFEKIQCFPFYTYNEDGSGRTENITDWALARFREVYPLETEFLPRNSVSSVELTKWDIFHYIYALLHHPVYRETYAANLRRELPRIPFARDFWGYARAGRRLAEIHVHYESQPEYPLRRLENPDERLNWRVEKMRLSKDKTEIRYNDFLTLAGVPPAAFDYRLGNRSALEWVIDQYQVSADKRSGITNDPNRDDDPQYIVRLLGQVITVSLETVEIVKNLPEWEIIGSDL